jgi:serine-type D-Ala-D-Ala carboxypeptidase (penicillin-binding protein 5/6)
VTTPAHPGPRSAGPVTAPVIGRDAALARVRGLVDPAPRSSQVLLVTGAAGMGKTVLLAGRARLPVEQQARVRRRQRLEPQLGEAPAQAGRRGATRQVPIASVAKLMTAYVILQDHPLSASGSGPDITVEPSEAAQYPSQVADGDSVVAVAAGETLTERQALEALLLPSADNMAWILARWDAGRQAAFAARMNAAARALAMTGTSYTDPSGLDPSTTSTAADQVRLGLAAMHLPALAAIIAESTAVVPVAGVVRNTNALLGHDGIVGLKTGSTQAAGGCLLVAARQQVNGHNVLIVAATFGQPGPAATILPNALQAGRNLVLALDAALDRG